ncbi:UNVERIFIED_CONTAM: hypothetical protein HDU68_000714 [Siphonaria sp. JEL0065]|nr:hypothetical protein HDU68_000714 [Siphonaria sp. JEL0065]
MLRSCPRHLRRTRSPFPGSKSKSLSLSLALTRTSVFRSFASSATPLSNEQPSNAFDLYQTLQLKPTQSKLVYAPNANPRPALVPRTALLNLASTTLVNASLSSTSNLALSLVSPHPGSLALLEDAVTWTANEINADLVTLDYLEIVRLVEELKKNDQGALPSNKLPIIDIDFFLFDAVAQLAEPVSVSKAPIQPSAITLSSSFNPTAYIPYSDSAKSNSMDDDIDDDDFDDEDENSPAINLFDGMMRNNSSSSGTVHHHHLTQTFPVNGKNARETGVSKESFDAIKHEETAFSTRTEDVIEYDSRVGRGLFEKGAALTNQQQQSYGSNFVTSTSTTSSSMSSMSSIITPPSGRSNRVRVRVDRPSKFPLVMTVSFADLVLPAPTKLILQTLVSLPLLRPDLFQSGILAKHSIAGVLLFVDLPPEEQRFQIMQVHLRDESLPSISLESLTQKTALYSGSDLKNVCISAASVKELILRESLPIESTEPLESNEILKKLESLDAKASSTSRTKTVGTTTKRELAVLHFDIALKDVPPSLTDEMQTLVELRQWDQKYGDSGSLGGKKKGGKQGWGFAGG